MSNTLSCDVVIPYCQNNLPWLQQSVESILSQTGVRPIVHLVADGFELEDDPARKFFNVPDVYLYRNREPIGPYRTVNRLLPKLKHKFIAIQDSDDIALPHRLATSINALVKEEGDLYTAPMRQFVQYEYQTDALLMESLDRRPVLKPGLKTAMCPKGTIINGTLVMRRSFFQSINGYAPLPGSADTELAGRAGACGAKVVYGKEVLGLRRMHRRSLSHGERGIGTAERQEWHKQIRTNLTQFVPGFDPRPFGGVEREEQYRPDTMSLDGGPPSPYWTRRKDSRYYRTVFEWVRGFAKEGGDLLDVGGGVSAGVQYLSWLPEFRCTAVETRGGDYTLPGVELVLEDYMKWKAPRRYDVVLCLQVLEHIEDARSFCQKLMSAGRVLILSVPYRWMKGSVKSHVHDPVDEAKLLSWTGREPNRQQIVAELTGTQRLVSVYLQ